MIIPKDQTSRADDWSRNLRKSVSGAMKGLSRQLFEKLRAPSVFLEDDAAPPSFWPGDWLEL
jgi:hypothetical protein